MFSNACNSNKSISPEAARFEKVLKDNNYIEKDSLFKYILWNENSCHGCKVKSLNMLNKYRFVNVKIIAPLSDEKLANNIDSQFILLDKNRNFSKLYFGISNIGIVCVKHGKVLSIKDYNVDEIENLEKDLKLEK
ncbi:MAG: hypothetical protein QM530_02100 [Phycisphaerales bacterium]|nr:hypothetical protein [Phycisphaerales bacterium]